MGDTIYRCKIQAIIKKRKTSKVFKLTYFKKHPIKKVLIKLRILSDASVLIKFWFNEQAPQKVLIELTRGVLFSTVSLYKLEEKQKPRTKPPMYPMNIHIGEPKTAFT